VITPRDAAPLTLDALRAAAAGLVRVAEERRKPILVRDLDTLRAAIEGTDLRLEETLGKRWHAELEGIRVLVVPFLEAGKAWRVQFPMALTDEEKREEIMQLRPTLTAFVPMVGTSI